uniref:Uncharacterized protein n=1 Tax=Oryza punctata TaxID=4537 RepID=A0A0E0MLH5_ORYPU
MARKALISLSVSNSTFHLDGEIQPANVAFPVLKTTNPRSWNPWQSCHRPGATRGRPAARRVRPNQPRSPLGPPFNYALTFTLRIQKSQTWVSNPSRRPTTGVIVPQQLICTPSFHGNDVPRPSRAYGGFTTPGDGSSPRPSKDESSYSLDSPPPKQPVRFMGARTPVRRGKVLIPPLSPCERRKVEASHSSPPIRRHISPPSIKRFVGDYESDGEKSLVALLTAFVTQLHAENRRIKDVVEEGKV